MTGDIVIRILGAVVGVWIFVENIPEFRNPPTFKLAEWVVYVLAVNCFTLLFIFPWRFFKTKGLWLSMYSLCIVSFVIMTYFYAFSLVWSALHGGYGPIEKFFTALVCIIVFLNFYVFWRMRPKSN